MFTAVSHINNCFFKQSVRSHHYYHHHRGGRRGKLKIGIKGRELGYSCIVKCSGSSNGETPNKTTLLSVSDSKPSNVDCVGTGLDVECVVNGVPEDKTSENDSEKLEIEEAKSVLEGIVKAGVLVSPFFFWGTAMVAMKEVSPLTGPFLVAAFRLIPAGFLLVGFAASRGRPFPSGFYAWLSIILFALVDASFLQGFLALGLERTSAGLGSVVIDSAPLTVAVLASLLFGESIGVVGALGLVLGVVGLSLLEVPALDFEVDGFSLWGSGELWMLLAAQSIAVGTVMVRWVSKYSDPVMAIGWHMLIGGLPLAVLSYLNHDPAFSC